MPTHPANVYRSYSRIIYKETGAYSKTTYESTGRTSNVLAASREQQADKYFIVKAVSRPGFVTQSVTYESSYFLLPLYRVETHYELEYVSEKFKDDYDVVLAAVLHDGRALKHASERLQKDKRLIALSYVPLLSFAVNCPATFTGLMTFCLALHSGLVIPASLGLAVVSGGVVSTTNGFFAKAPNDTESTDSKPVVSEEKLAHGAV